MNEWICVWMPTIWHHLGSVLWLLQLRWTKQSPPGDQRHRRDRALVAEPSSLQGTGLQWSECYPGPWAGEIIIPYSAMNSCLPAAACSLNNDCCVVTVKYSTSMLLREEKESVSALVLVLQSWDEICYLCELVWNWKCFLHHILLRRCVLLLLNCFGYARKQPDWPMVSFTKYSKGVTWLLFSVGASSPQLALIMWIMCCSWLLSRNQIYAAIGPSNILPSWPVSLEGVWLKAHKTAPRTQLSMWGKRGILSWD